MKLGIVGSGMIVQDVLPVLNSMPEIELVAIFGRTNKKEHLEKLQVNYHIKHIYVDYQEMLASSKLDTVYIALPNHLHFSYAKQALEAGKHVICEKPFTSNIEELKILADIAQSKELYLLEAITNQYRENYLQIKNRLDNLGEIKIIEANYSQYSSRYSAFKEGTILPAFDPKMSGGALMDINSYNIHFVVGLFGEPNDIAYYPNLTNGIDTSGILILDYGQFKAVCIGAKDSNGPSSATIQGENGTIYVNGPVSSISSFTYKDRLKMEEEVHINTHKHRMYEEFLEFEQIIREKNQEKMRYNLKHSLKVMDIMTIARRSVGIKFPADDSFNKI
ncbi:Gfo/Idh/MocA family protein [Bacillus sp. B1-b2]|uniref:Gfo/Idh/MocA family protein n=1 Tax=Bacillus sp. B1-b2 TaxID=2653201 RepID=UPI001261515D|nr:Gfo/Idh/MocA family oxidoreductase [Bacillus sp. B1-b2]KAB7667093.1 Gfo/Idh/MocA family oxidoreductase [Bacillus sp. B1-b2]